MGALLSFLLLPLLFVFCLTLITKKFSGSRRRLPPSPPKLPILGNLHQLGSSLPHQSLHQLSKKCGPVMLLQLGFSPTVIISSAEAAKEVLKTHDLDCCSRPALHGTRKLSRNYLDIGFAPYGDRWREMRKIAVLELFSTKKVQSSRVVREDEVNLLVKSLSESAVKQSPVNMSKSIFTLTAGIIFRVVFGQNVHESKFMDKDRIEELVFEAETILASFTATDFFPAGVGWVIDWLTGQHKRLDRIFKELDKFFQLVIDDHLRPGREVQNHQDIVDVLLDLTKKQGEKASFKLTTDSIKGVLLNVFLAGIDTSAITIIWAMTELVRNPKLMKKAQEEIRRNISKTDKITEQDIENLHYLKMIIKETFRLHPAAPLLLPRETMNQVKIQGYDIPAKTRLQINFTAIGRDPKYWENPEEFIPERFENSLIDYKGQNFELLPFGAGRRACPGMAMGIATVELALANLLFFFDWKLPEGMTENDINMEEDGTLTIIKKVPLELVPVLH